MSEQSDAVEPNETSGGADAGDGPPPGGTPAQSAGRDTSWWHEASAPRRVENGIKARSKRGAIGEQWWSRRFVAVLESFGMSGRLARGRNYARRGQVMEFELGTGKVRARVQGSRPAPYQVRIGVLPLTTAQWRSVTAALGAQALFRAKLLAGEMPHEIEEVFAACGTPLFPRSARDLEMSCSCPDWGVPCKHLAAVCYVLAEKFDDDPFEMLAWRGRGREELLGALRRQSSAPDPGPRWVELDEGNLRAALKFMERGREGVMRAGDVLLAGLRGPEEDLEVTAVTADGWLGDLLSGAGDRSLTPVTAPGLVPRRPAPLPGARARLASMLGDLGRGASWRTTWGSARGCRRSRCCTPSGRRSLGGAAPYRPDPGRLPDVAGGELAAGGGAFRAGPGRARAPRLGPADRRDLHAALAGRTW